MIFPETAYSSLPQKTSNRTPGYYSTLTPRSWKKNIIRVRGRISWTRKASGLDIYGVGVEFMVLDPLAQTRLESLLSKAARDKVEISRHVHLKQIKEL